MNTEMEKMSESSLETFFSGLNATLNSVREIRKLYDPVMAFDFNSINFLLPGENKISEILAFFLDPNENHGQGSIFLKKFFEQIKRKDILDLIGDEKIKVECEHPTDAKRRIDILITIGDSDFLIGIENKIYHTTTDGESQLSDYNVYLKEKAKSNEKYLLLYLAPKGKKPSEASMTEANSIELEKSEHFKIVSYEEQIISCVHQWSMFCQPLRVKSFLQDFEQYLRTKYTGERFMNEYETIVKVILDNPQKNIETAFAIVGSLDQMKTVLVGKLKGLVKEIGRGLELEVDLSDNLGQKDSYFSFYKVDWKQNIIFYFDGNFSNLGIGIGLRDNQDENDFIIKNTKEKIFSKLDNGKSKIYPEWTWFSSYEGSFGDWNNSPEPWIAIADGTMKSWIENEITVLRDKLKGIPL